MSSFAFPIILVGSLLLSGCSDPSVEKKAEFPIESHKVAVFEYNYGATVDYVYRFYFLANTSEVTKAPDPDQAFLEVSDIENMKVEIEGDKIFISCIAGDIYSYDSRIFVDGKEYFPKLNQRCGD
ncbi:hypothetical protein [Zooshikella sp. RANM57]|uniref:hypothetical protein n=1 Tax=Zooshikella sp. RANM57 TaxID=3425863 RepID=UPI003D6E2179